ncbi:hypothetical protein CUMW_270310 [Citrus unshiu]|nr:hypothetical protein CUMW_270310 [Citrus unshiu]
MICILIAVPASHGDGDGDVDEQYMSCNSSHSCGTLQDIRYPFWVHNIRPQFCGLRRFELECHDNEYATIGIGHQSFRVLEINNTHPIMRIVIADYVGRDCLESIRESSISDPLFNYTEKVRNLSLFYNCSGDFSSQPDKNKYRCTSEAGVVIRSFYTIDNYDDSPLHNLSNSCSSVIKVPIQLTHPNIRYLTDGRLIETLNQGFEVRYVADDKLCSTCTSSQSGGICGSNQSSDEFSCLYPPRHVFVHLNKTKRLVVQNHEASLFPPPILNPILTFMICFLIAVTASQGDGDVHVVQQPHSCGNLWNIRYPFWGNSHKASVLWSQRFRVPINMRNILILPYKLGSDYIGIVPRWRTDDDCMIIKINIKFAFTAMI